MGVQRRSRRRMGRRGVELALNVLVTIILGIVMLGAGIYIFVVIFSGADILVGDVDAQAREQIREQMARTGEAVAAAETSKATKPGELTTYGVGIKNVLDDPSTATQRKVRCFLMEVTFNKAYDSQDNEMSLDASVKPKEWIVPRLTSPPGSVANRNRLVRQAALAPDEEVFLSFGIQPPRSSAIKKGKYEYLIHTCQIVLLPNQCPVVSTGYCVPSATTVFQPYPPNVKVYAVYQ